VDFASAPDKRDALGVQRMISQDQDGALLVIQAPVDKVQVVSLVAAIKLITHDWVAVMRQVNPDLMLPSGEWPDGQE
jgi:hypothetical protein